MKLWAKNKNVNQVINDFTVGKDRILDILLAPYDVLGSLAHIKMLNQIGLLNDEELQLLQLELKNIYQEIKAGDFKLEETVEDIHSQIEFNLTQKLGEIGKKIHAGRSRNDQVLLDLCLFYRAEIQDLIHTSKNLFDLLIQLSEAHKDKLMPGYTHYQIAMPSSFGLWFGSYAESLIDDVDLLQKSFDIINKNPLGSAAGYGSSFPLDRDLTTALLGFETMRYNVVYAQMGRGKNEFIIASAMASIAFTINKLAQDICLFMGQNFGFISFPDELTTGSSIMPHKKNPDVFELIRAKTNILKNLPNQIALLTTNLPHGYHRDFQLTKEFFLPEFSTLNQLLQLTHYMLSNIKVTENILTDEKYQYLFSVETVNQLVLEGMPFRAAYKKVGLAIEAGDYQPPQSIHHTHKGSIHNLCNTEIKALMDKIYCTKKFDKIDSAIQALWR